jgi:hypothetical protein
MASDSTGADRRQISERTWLLLVAGAGLAIALFLLWKSRSQTFYADEWAFYVRAAGFNSEQLLSPHLGNLIVGTVLLYKVVLGIGGAEDHLALSVIWVVLDLACAGLFFALMRTRVGNFAAFVPAVLLTLFGSAWEFFGGSLGITAMLCVGGGLGALLALERRALVGDVFACLLLLLSLSALSTGIAFLAGAVAMVLIYPDRWRRIWVVAIPLILYAGWSLWARKYGASGVTAQTIGSAPAAVVASLASASSALFGAFRVPGAAEPGTTGLIIFANESTGTLIGAVLVVVAIWRLRERGFALRLVPFLAMPLIYWGTLALVSPARDPSTGRYQYAAAIMILLLFAELWRGWRPSRGAMAGIAALGAVALIPNAINLGYATDLVRSVSEQDRAKLAVVDALGKRVSPETVIEPPGATIGAELVIEAGDYRRAREEFGSPAYSLDELPNSSILARQAADREFVYLLEIHPERAKGPINHRRCRLIPPGEIGADGIPAPRGGFVVRPTAAGKVTVGLRRYSENFLQLEAVEGSSPFLVRLPGDGISQPWQLALGSVNPMRVCSLA